MLHPEEKQYFKDMAFVQAQKEWENVQIWEEWQEQLEKEQKAAKILINHHAYERIKKTDVRSNIHH